mgnify:CR=1 FL=1
MQAVRIVLSGRITYLLGQDLRCGGWSSVCIFFDVCEPFGTCNMFARICEADRERFATACRNVWDNQGMYIKNEIVEIEAEA